MKIKKAVKFVVVSFVLFLIVSFNLNLKAYAEKANIYFEDGTGNLKIEVMSHKASSKIRFRTVDWMVTTRSSCSPNKTECEPTNYIKVGYDTKGRVDKDPPNPKPGEEFMSTYTLERAVVNEIFKTLQDRTPSFYFHAVLESYNYPAGTLRKGPCYKLSCIKGAESWANPKDLENYYDIDIPDNEDHPFNIITRVLDRNGQEVYIDSKEIKKYKLFVDINYEVPAEFDYNGQKVPLLESFLKPTIYNNETEILFKDAQHRDWNFMIYPGGTDIVMTYILGEVPPPNKPPGKCQIKINTPTKGQTMPDKVMDPSATAVLKADIRGSEQFNVLMGIPTSENLYGNVFANEYLFRQNWVNMRGDVSYDIDVLKTFIKTWTRKGKPPTKDDHGTPDIPRTKIEHKKETIKVKRDYRYWQIDNLEVYGINNAILSNYALGGMGGSVTLSPEGYDPPRVASLHSKKVEDHVIPSPCDQIDLGEQDVPGGYNEPPLPNYMPEFKAKAEESIEENKVKNDYVNFNGDTIMDDQEATTTTPTPSSIPKPSIIHQDVLYQNQLTISNSLTNKANQPTTGIISYNLLSGNIGGGKNESFSIPNINPVTMHTPVVNFSAVSDDQRHNQKSNPNLKRSALILERPFVVRIPTSGQHLPESSYPGYGNRDYAKYFKTKQVRFPFDVYDATQTIFHPKDTWIDIPVEQLETTFFLPVWVDEGDYQVYFRNIAENAPDHLPYQYDANLDLVNHVAADEVAVEVIGRLYDFHITDVADYNWERVFRVAVGSSERTGISYWIGDKNIDGDRRGNSSPYMLSIYPGSHPLQGYKNAVIKTGYHFKFDLKTKGNMFGQQDGILITPQFRYASKTGKDYGDVDLYYSTDQKPFVKIGSKQDVVQRYTILNERLRNVPVQELIDSAKYEYQYETEIKQGGKVAGLTKESYIDRFINKQSKQKTPIGSYSLLLLPRQLGTMIGPKDWYLNNTMPASVNQMRANVAVQRWYGEYSLPAAPYIVKKGTNLGRYGTLDDKSTVFLQNSDPDGFIIVNFNIESIRDGNLKEPHLQYIHAPMMNQTVGEGANKEKYLNQWLMEGFQNKIVDAYGNHFNLIEGDTVFYHGNKSNRDDFGSYITH
ncbi:DUF5704 domain-containing protein [Paenibacillus turicensis]|uniref:DUF5704 domain-containing protein n=1 Tax=Paenibacillus turicensis TaxID=160487 RepID=UPI003D2BF1FE